MQRRRLLAGAAGLAAAGYLGATTLRRLRSPVESREFTIIDPESEAFERAPGPTEPPAVGFEPDASRVVVTGSFFVGSSSCDRAVLERAVYDGDDDALRVVVVSGTQPDSGFHCSGDESIDAYRLVVTFEDNLPDTVTVAEGTGRDRVTTTANRAE